MIDSLVTAIEFETVNFEIDRHLAGRIITTLRTLTAECDALTADNARLVEEVTDLYAQVAAAQFRLDQMADHAAKLKGQQP
jgi:hypothetical protein